MSLKNEFFNSHIYCFFLDHFFLNFWHGPILCITFWPASKRSNFWIQESPPENEVGDSSHLSTPKLRRLFSKHHRVSHKHKWQKSSNSYHLQCNGENKLARYKFIIIYVYGEVVAKFTNSGDFTTKPISMASYPRKWRRVLLSAGSPVTNFFTLDN